VTGGAELPTLSEGWGSGGTPRRPNILAMPQGLNQRSKIEEVVQTLTCQRGSDVGNAEVGELDPAEASAGACKKNSSILSCIGKRSL